MKYKSTIEVISQVTEIPVSELTDDTTITVGDCVNAILAFTAHNFPMSETCRHEELVKTTEEYYVCLKCGHEDIEQKDENN